ncbi:hypothetical protein [Streptomyces sp. NPDC049879]|uniref:hypothetical protein n=1 Tax=Streptomyces sp. NPDC049879 TaxID=3365598 RepID=UPI0037BD9F2B
MTSSLTRLFRTAEGFLLVNQGTMRSYGSRFSAVELLYDSDVAKQAGWDAGRQ